MTYWAQKLPKYFRIGPYGLTATAIITLSVLFRTILVVFHFPEVNSDEGKMGIAGMHIAFQGQHPIYHYGQDYLGIIEAYIAAPFFRLFGISDITLRIGMLIMFALFMIVMYWLASLLYSKRLALVHNHETFSGTKRCGSHVFYFLLAASCVIYRHQKRFYKRVSI
jgi:predicted membrane-bound mannosyltransferase